MKDDEFTDNEKRTIWYANTAFFVDSIDQTINEDEEDSQEISYYIKSDANTEMEALKNLEKKSIESIIEKCLTERERWVITHRFGLNGGKIWTLDELGKACPGRQITRERVRQIEAKAIKTLKRALSQPPRPTANALEVGACKSSY